MMISFFFNGRHCDDDNEDINNDEGNFQFTLQSIILQIQLSRTSHHPFSNNKQSGNIANFNHEMIMHTVITMHF